MARVQRLRPEGLVFSPAFRHVAVIPPGATTIYVGGQNAVDADGALVGADDVAAQTTPALRNARTALAAAGATTDDMVRWTVDFVDGTDLAAAYGAIATELASDEPPLVTGQAGGRARCTWSARGDRRDRRSAAMSRRPPSPDHGAAG
jgi:enamine deaminase RidA (YjgF/YER057c/UK114 family)